MRVRWGGRGLRRGKEGPICVPCVPWIQTLSAKCRMKTIKTWLVVLRMNHWIKKLFVLVPFLVGPRFRLNEYLMRSISGTVLFGVMSSAVYLLNNILYSVAPETQVLHGTDNLIFTTPFVVYWIYRFLLKAREGRRGDPSSAFSVKKAVSLAWGRLELVPWSFHGSLVGLTRTGRYMRGSKKF